MLDRFSTWSGHLGKPSQEWRILFPVSCWSSLHLLLSSPLDNFNVMPLHGQVCTCTNRVQSVEGGSCEPSASVEDLLKDFGFQAPLLMDLTADLVSGLLDTGSAAVLCVWNLNLGRLSVLHLCHIRIGIGNSFLRGKGFRNSGNSPGLLAGVLDLQGIYSLIIKH